ncbi:MAG: glycerophosphodiester phosphodiesterase [Provencibacterium sp.]|jgi:glycerophosphoryl diester phosphodiesterase|nr:glycerophosphodiester phosphodiesterase [Provencibacterium sp.]
MNLKLPLITAHSGCEHTPRDSMDSIDCAIALGADAIEMDIRRAEHGLLYISHDRQQGSAVNEKETLESVFRRIQHTALRFNCDIKEPSALYGTLEMAKRFHFGPDRLILTGSVSPEMLALEPEIMEQASVYLNIEQALKFLYMGKLSAEKNEAQFPELMNNANAFTLGMLKEQNCVASLIRLIKSLHVHALNMYHIVLTEDLAKAFQSQGIACSVWTVNEADDQERCLRLGVDNITTVAVRSALERREQYRLSVRHSAV